MEACVAYHFLQSGLAHTFEQRQFPQSGEYAFGCTVSTNAQKGLHGILAVATGSLEERIAFWIISMTISGDAAVFCGAVASEPEIRAGYLCPMQ